MRNCITNSISIFDSISQKLTQNLSEVKIPDMKYYNQEEEEDEEEEEEEDEY